MMHDQIETSVSSIDDEIIVDEGFTYDGYQVVRGEFFAHLHEPSITFNNCKLSANTACVNKLPDVEYVQIRVNPEEMKLIIQPCREDDKGSFLWSSVKQENGRKNPRQITCKVFIAMVYHMMDWNPDYRYKLMGKLIKSNGENFFVFDLKAAEVYHRIRQDDEGQ